VSAVDYLASAHALTAIAVVSFDQLPQLQAGLSVLADLPPPGGGLRIHALYRVWQI
jgi:hypothetical protein